MSEPRRHHYCPAGYLANFATPSDRNGRLIVVNPKTAQERPSTPNNEAHERDFYKIDTDDSSVDPFALEKEFGKIEGPALAAIRDAITCNKLPDDEGMNWIINFIGLLCVRVPANRDRWEKFEKEIYTKILQMSVASKKRYESIISKVNFPASGQPGTSYEEMQEFINSDRFTIKVSQNSLLSTMLQQASTATDLLLQRNWALLIADGDGEFISCDSPVVIRWIKPIRGFFSPGLGLNNTEVSLTISPKHMIVGVFEKLSGVFAVDDFGVACANEYLHLKAKRWVYSKSGNPITIGPSEKVVSLSERIQNEK